MIIIINGSLGVGKTSVADQIMWKFDKAIHLDGDAIGNVHPFEIYNPARIENLYRALELLVRFHRQIGYHNVVINYVFESPGSLQNLLDLLRPLDSSIHIYWLTCEAGEQSRRIQSRRRPDLDWELNRFIELQRIQRQAAQRGFLGIEVDTTGLALPEVADKIWQDIFG